MACHIIDYILLSKMPSVRVIVIAITVLFTAILLPAVNAQTMEESFAQGGDPYNATAMCEFMITNPSLSAADLISCGTSEHDQPRN